MLTPAFAESVEDYEQIIPSENGTLNIGLSLDPPAKANEVSKLHIGWIKPGFNKIQEHIDYTVTVIKDGENIFGPIPLTHTSIGTVKIPVEFTSNGEHQVKIEMEGILFQPISTWKLHILQLMLEENRQYKKTTMKVVVV